MYMFSDLARIVFVTPNAFLGSIVSLLVKNELDVETCSINVNELCSVFDIQKLYSVGKFNFLLFDWEAYVFTDFVSFFNKYNQEVKENSIFAVFNAEKNEFVEKKIISLGVQGVFYKDSDFSIFKKGIMALLDGEVWFSRKALFEYIKEKNDFQCGNECGELSSSFAQEERENDIKKKVFSLTPREEEILTLISLGKSNHTIASELYISPSTVKTHIYNIFQKIHVPNRIQAALWAVRYLPVDNEFSSE